FASHPENNDSDQHVSFPLNPTFPLKHKKRGAVEAPRFLMGCVFLCQRLEIEFQPELQTAHSRAESKSSDLAAVAAIYATVRPIKVYMVENVIRGELKLCLKSLRKVEILE